MALINTPINGHDSLATFTKLVNLLIQPQSGDGSAVTSGDGATHKKIGLDEIINLLVETANVNNNLTTNIPGKVLDARQGKVLADQIQAIIDQKAVAEGIATLDTDGKVPAEQIPEIALVDVFPVASESEMLALDAQQGDMAIRTDESMIYILGSSPASTLGNWIELTAIETLIQSYINELAGTGRTTETVKDNAEDISTLNSDSSTSGSVAYRIKNDAEAANFTPGTSGLDSLTIAAAIKEIYEEKASANGIATLDASSKIPSAQLPISAMEYKGSWDASTTNYPTSPDTGDYWLVSVAGTAGGEDYDAGDAIIYNGSSWDKINKIEIAEEVALSSTRYTAADVKNALEEIAGSGRTSETVKQNADEINNLKNSTAQIFGLDWDKTTDSYTRTDMAAGLTIGSPDGANKIVSDFNNYYPWKGIKQVKVDSNKRILAYLGDALYSSIDGEYMTLIPQFWFQDYIDGTVRKVRISHSPLAGYKPAFLDSAGNPVEYRLVGRVPAGYDTELRSKPDMAVEVNRSYTSFITTAYAKGSWWLDDAMIRHKIGLLAGVEAGDWDVKARYGQGINSGMPYGSGSEYECVSAQTGANSIIIADTVSSFYVGMVVQIGTAYTNNSITANRKITSIVDNGNGTQTITVDGAAFDTSLGDTIVTWGQPVPADQIDALDGGSGYILQWDSESRSHVSYRGIWDLWGNVWSFTYGFARYDGRYYVCFDQTKYDVSDPRSDAGWIDTGKGEYIDNGYQNERIPFVSDQGSVDFPVSTGGGAGSSTFYAAYLYNFHSAYGGVRILLSGGIWNHGGFVSLFYVLGSYAPSNSNHLIGSRLIG